jgi:hypothetical protein
MTPRTTTHADFTAAPERLRYTGVLAELFPLLERELSARPPLAWRVLPHGALVGLIRKSDGVRMLRIARRERPEDGKRIAWDRELATFLRHFGCESWTRRDDDSATGVAAEFTEPREPGMEG